MSSLQDLGGNGLLRWFIGTVESINDPLKLGRAKVRIPALQDGIFTEELIWARPISPVQSASYYGIGISPNGLLNGSLVFGFFLTGTDGNIPMIVGSICKHNNNDPNQSDVNALAREVNDIPKTQIEYESVANPGVTFKEPKPTYAAKYPHNHVMRTVSGHTVEFDDTPGSNRIHIYHSSGTFIEISNDGDQTTKIKGNSTDITLKDEKVFIEGKSTIIVKGEAEIYSDTKITLQAPEISINGG